MSVRRRRRRRRVFKSKQIGQASDKNRDIGVGGHKSKLLLSRP